MDTNTQSIPKWLWLTFGILIILFVALAVVDKFHTVQNDFKSQAPQNTITISGDGKVTAAPDLATVSMGVLTNAITAAQAQTNNTTKVNAVIAFLKQQNVAAADITTTQLNLNPQYDYSTNPLKITAYQADQSISVKVHGVDKSTTQLDAIIGGATTAGANEIDSVSLDFENPDDLKEQAREMAIDQAKQKAQQLATTAGLKLGKIVSISEVDTSTPYPVPFAVNSTAGGAAPAMAVAPNIQTGTQDITATMNVVFAVN